MYIIYTPGQHRKLLIRILLAQIQSCYNVIMQANSERSHLACQKYLKYFQKLSKNTSQAEELLSILIPTSQESRASFQSFLGSFY